VAVLPADAEALVPALADDLEDLAGLAGNPDRVSCDHDLVAWSGGLAVHRPSHRNLLSLPPSVPQIGPSLVQETSRRRRTRDGVAEIPDTIVLKRDRDLDGRAWQAWLRRGLFSLLPIVSVLALLNVFGQRPATSTAEAQAATLKMYAPRRVRSGVLYGARFTITARRELQNATLLLDPGWLEGITVNTIEPSPVGEASADGRLSLELGRIPAGEIYRLFMHFQVNPTNVGNRSQAVTLYDDEEKLLEIDRSITVFP
jgi:hypothetical protein